MKRINVTYLQELANRYDGKFVSCLDISEDNDITLIPKNHSAILIHNNKPVLAIIRDVAKIPISNYLGAKIMVTIKAHYPINRGNQHSSHGTMVGHGSRENITKIPSFNYSYKKDVGPNAKKILDNSGNTLAKWLYDNGKHYLPFVASSYEEFKAQVNLEDDALIGAVFCTKNYEAAGHTDNDRSEYAIAYVYEEGIVEEGYFFYPGYGTAIEMSSNSIWCWLPQSVHGTAKLNLSKGGTRYTAAISLTEKTAKSIEKRSNS
jgi:hypothetical protein